MKKTYAIIPFIFLSLTFLGCTNEESDEVRTITDIEGTIQGSVSCNTEERGLAFKIDPSNFTISSGFIITATLSEELKKEGLRIKFDMRPSQKYITTCTANYFPEQFYEVFNVTVLDNPQ